LPGELIFINQGNIYSHVVTPAQLAESSEKDHAIRVPSVRLSEVVPLHTIRFLKVDIEGAEPHAFLTLKPHFEAHLVQFGIMEFNAKRIDDLNPGQMKFVFAMLANSGYRLSFWNGLRWPVNQKKMMVVFRECVKLATEGELMFYHSDLEVEFERLRLLTVKANAVPCVWCDASQHHPTLANLIRRLSP